MAERERLGQATPSGDSQEGSNDSELHSFITELLRDTQDLEPTDLLMTSGDLPYVTNQDGRDMQASGLGEVGLQAAPTPLTNVPIIMGMDRTQDTSAPFAPVPVSLGMVGTQDTSAPLTAVQFSDIGPNREIIHAVTAISDLDLVTATQNVPTAATTVQSLQYRYDDPDAFLLSSDILTSGLPHSYYLGLGSEQTISMIDANISYHDPTAQTLSSYGPDSQSAYMPLDQGQMLQGSIDIPPYEAGQEPSTCRLVVPPICISQPPQTIQQFTPSASFVHSDYTLPMPTPPVTLAQSGFVTESRWPSSQDVYQYQSEYTDDFAQTSSTQPAQSVASSDQVQPIDLSSLEEAGFLPKGISSTVTKKQALRGRPRKRPSASSTVTCTTQEDTSHHKTPRLSESLTSTAGLSPETDIAQVIIDKVLQVGPSSLSHQDRSLVQQGTSESTDQVLSLVQQPTDELLGQQHETEFRILPTSVPLPIASSQPSLSRTKPSSIHSIRGVIVKYAMSSSPSTPVTTQVARPQRAPSLSPKYKNIQLKAAMSSPSFPSLREQLQEPQASHPSVSQSSPSRLTQSVRPGRTPSTSPGPSPKYTELRTTSSPIAFPFPPHPENLRYSPGAQTGSPQISPASFISSSPSTRSPLLGEEQTPGRSQPKSSIRERLQESIKQRRGSLSLEEPDTEGEVQGSELTPEEKLKKEKRRAQNRRAAQRCRQKKKDAADDVSVQYKKLQTSNTGLRQVIKKLEKERSHLSNVLDSHMKVCKNLERTIEMPATAKYSETVECPSSEDESTSGSHTSDEE